MLEVLMVYAGLLVGLAGIVSLARPLHALGIRTRRAAAGVLALGLVLAAAGALWTASLVARVGDRSRLDEFVPVCQFREFHEIRVHAPASAVFRAVKSVTAGEIRFFRLLTWIRSPRFSRERGENILAAPADKPLLEVALHSGFLPLAEDPDKEVVIGTIFGGGLRVVGEGGPREFARLDRPGVCKVAMNFRLREEPGGWVRLSTETRVLALGSSARRTFAVYWRVIYPGSALIRRMWLAAIRRRAEDALGSCLEELEAVTRPVNKALELFESGGPAAKREASAAQRVLAEARLAREKLESTAAEPPCLRSKQEDLVFLNHLILGFQAYIGSGSRDAKSLDSLESIIRRARVHQARGRTGA
ncbi:MAG TPA: hypothetical protein VLU06_08555 [Thermoanaerobaculia bacterium]|nr:hypothetical protein [Thermoanaerobaculia bacterium]